MSIARETRGSTFLWNRLYEYEVCRSGVGQNRGIAPHNFESWNCIQYAVPFYVQQLNSLMYLRFGLLRRFFASDSKNFKLTNYYRLAEQVGRFLLGSAYKGFSRLKNYFTKFDYSFGWGRVYMLLWTNLESKIGNKSGYLVSNMKDKMIQAPIKSIRNEDFKFSMAIFANK